MLFLSCHLLSFNQDRPGCGECVRNRRKLSKLYDKSCRGKRSVSITGAVCNGGEGPRSSTNGSDSRADVLDMERLVRQRGLCRAGSLTTFGALVFPARRARLRYQLAAEFSPFWPKLLLFPTFFMCRPVDASSKYRDTAWPRVTAAGTSVCVSFGLCCLRVRPPSTSCPGLPSRLGQRWPRCTRRSVPCFLQWRRRSGQSF